MYEFSFYLFSSVAIIAAFLVVLARNPVHSVLWLILTFFSAAGLFVLLGAEFLAALLMIVYVGAVAVLFLFVVMMLDIDFAELKEGALQNMPLAVLIGIVFTVELVFALSARHFSNGEELTPYFSDVENTRALGQILYTEYFLAFLGAGMALFVAMIGAIVLTLRHRDDVKRQNVLAQMYRDPKKSMELKDVPPGKGI